MGIGALGRCAVAALASVVLQATGEPCPASERQAVVQLTSQRCDDGCCFDLEDFIRDREYVYVLFYRKRGRLNNDLVAKFEQTAEEWRWSRIFFAKIDTDIDRNMVSPHVQPNMVPTNIIFKRGVGVEVALADLEVLKNKYQAGPRGQRWWLTKYLGTDQVGGNLHYVTPARTASDLRRIVAPYAAPAAAAQDNQAGSSPNADVVVIVGFFKEDDLDDDDEDLRSPGSPWDVFHQFAWRAQQVGGAAATGGRRSSKVSSGGGFWNASSAGVRFAAATKQSAPQGAAAAPSAVLMIAGAAKASIPLGGRKRPKATAEALARWALDALRQGAIGSRHTSNHAEL